LVINPQQTIAVTLAGGFGTRLRQVLRDVPKPMAPVAGRPFLEWVLRYLAKQGIGKAVLSTGYLAEIIEDHFVSQPVAGITTCCVKEAEPLGTGGGFLQSARAAGEKPLAWLVLNGDSLALAELRPAFNELSVPEVVAVLVGCQMKDASRYGTLSVSAEGRLLGFEEKRRGSGVINAGVYLFKHELLDKFPNRFPLSFEKEVFPNWIRDGLQIKVVQAEVPFLDIGTPESLTQAEAFVRANSSHFAQ
jgi:D-glycero-alpha-D-manno-heptose 1-phosphate guanylyltransferase